MWTAPGIWPSSHSSCSRTSIQAASWSPAPHARRPGRFGLDLPEKFPVARHDFKNYSSLFAHSRGYRWRQALYRFVESGRGPVVSSPRQRSLPRASSSGSPWKRARRRTSRRSRRARRPCRGTCRRRGARRSSRPSRIGRKGNRRDAADRAAVDESRKQRARPVLPRHRTDLGRVSERRAGRARAREEARPRHDHPGAAPTTCFTRRTSSPPGAPSTRSSSRRGRTGCSQLGSRLQPQGTSLCRAALPAGGERKPERRRGARRPGGGPLRRGQPDARRSPISGRSRALPEEPARASTISAISSSGPRRARRRSTSSPRRWRSGRRRRWGSRRSRSWTRSPRTRTPSPPSGAAVKHLASRSRHDVMRE